MVEEQLVPRGICDKAVLAAMGEVPREEIVPSEMRRWAYEDGPLPIGHGQTISLPFIVAYLTKVMELVRSARVLEIGLSQYPCARWGWKPGTALSSPLRRHLCNRRRALGARALKKQLSPGGSLVITVGKHLDLQELVRVQRTGDDEYVSERLIGGPLRSFYRYRWLARRLNARL
jgi:protein-L-isoaspartate(D-aspartate) O-methyltransferase